MSDQTNVSDVNQDGGAGTDQQKGGKDSVSYETYQRVLREAKAAKEKAKQLEEEQTKIAESKLKEQNEWKALAEQKEKALAETQSKLSELESTILESVKLQAFQQHLGGKLKDPSYRAFVDVDSIVYHPETKKVDEDSVKQVVAAFVKKHSALVDFQQGKMPNTAARGTDGKFTKKLEEMTREELEKEILSRASKGLL